MSKSKSNPDKGKNARKAFNDAPENHLSNGLNKITLVWDENSNSPQDYNSIKYSTTRVIQFLQEKYFFRFNQINQLLEFRKNTEKEFRFFNNRDFQNIYTELKLNNVKIGRDALKALIESEYISADYDPFKEYLFKLPKWDCKSDHIKRYLEQIYLSGEENRKDFIESFKKWFVALVASLINDRTVNQQCLVLVGEQGKFKTTFLNNLVPKHLQLDYLYSSKFNFENKDHYKFLGTKMLINLDELATLSRTDVGVLKTILTDDRIIVRLPYGAFDTNMWRRASFCGSTNNEQFLTDETGNRRFLCFKIDNIVLDKDFDLDLIYVQALGLYKEGYKYWFDRDDISGIEKKNERFFNNTIEQDLIQQYIEKPSDQDIRLGHNIQYKTATDINVWLTNKSNRINVNETTKSRVGSILRKLGFKQISKRLANCSAPMKVWCVRYVDAPRFVDESGHQEVNLDEFPI